MSNEPEQTDPEDAESEDEELLRRQELLAKVRAANEHSLKWPR